MSSVDLREELRAAARSLLEDHRADVIDADRWTQLGQAGWLAIESPEVLEGGGAGFGELAVLLEELGRAGAASSTLGSIVLGLGALHLVAPTSARDRLVREVGSGTRIALVVATGDDALDDLGTGLNLCRGERGLRLRGRASSVPDLVGAEHLLVLATGLGSLRLVHLDPRSPGVHIGAQESVDATRQLGYVVVDDVLVDEEQAWSFSLPADEAARALVDRGALAVTIDSIGVAGSMVDATVAYVSDRRQFGRPIGSFQAVKHACADMLVSLTVGHELVAEAVRAVEAGAPDRSLAVSMAKAFVCEQAVKVTGSAMQLHGGIGYSWETGVHTYLKRATLNRVLFGSPAAHRRRLSERYAPAEEGPG